MANDAKGADKPFVKLAVDRNDSVSTVENSSLVIKVRNLFCRDSDFKSDAVVSNSENTESAEKSADVANVWLVKSWLLTISPGSIIASSALNFMLRELLDLRPANVLTAAGDEAAELTSTLGSSGVLDVAVVVVVLVLGDDLSLADSIDIEIFDAKFSSSCSYFFINCWLVVDTLFDFFLNLASMLAKVCRAANLSLNELLFCISRKINFDRIEYLRQNERQCIKMEYIWHVQQVHQLINKTSRYLEYSFHGEA
uniref:Uncharacterized protein n=1 Tax=Romanomermis culicivorax TaxID=13658 RepID=A0A915HQQ8_ROMCU